MADGRLIEVLPQQPPVPDMVQAVYPPNLPPSRRSVHHVALIARRGGSTRDRELIPTIFAMPLPGETAPPLLSQDLRAVIFASVNLPADSSKFAGRKMLMHDQPLPVRLAAEHRCFALDNIPRFRVKDFARLCTVGKDRDITNNVDVRFE